MSQHDQLKNNDALGGRLPLLRPQDLDADQHKIYEYLQESKISWANRTHFQGILADGRMIGPFNLAGCQFPAACGVPGFVRKHFQAQS